MGLPSYAHPIIGEWYLLSSSSPVTTSLLRSGFPYKILPSVIP